MKNLYCLIFLILISPVFGEVVIKDGQEVYGIWHIENSPFIIEKEAVIPEGKVLIIEPGVEVLFHSLSDSDPTNFDFPTNKSGRLHVFGSLQAIGERRKLIRFDSHAEGKWGSIYFDSTSQGNILTYCQLQHSYGVSLLRPNVITSATLVLYKSDLKISNCLLNDNWRGIQVTDSKLNLSHSTLINNEEVGLISSGSSEIDIFSCLIWGSYYSFYPSLKRLNSDGTVLKISYLGIPDASGPIPGTQIFHKEPSFSQGRDHNYNFIPGSFYYDKGPHGEVLGFQ